MFFKRKRKYLLATADMQEGSAGVRVTLLLANWLNRHGYKCYSNVIARDRSLKIPCIPFCFNEKQFKDLVGKQDAISILPEIVDRNIYNTRTIARYVLGVPDIVPKRYTENGNVFVYCDTYAKFLSYDTACRAKELFISPIEQDLFFENGTVKDIEGCWYKGKTDICDNFKDIEIPETKNLVEITRVPLYPNNRRELAGLLRRSKVFYTYDSMTAMITEARLCGTPVVIIKNPRQAFNPDSFNSNEKLGVVYNSKDIKLAISELKLYQEYFKSVVAKTERQLWDFVKITQGA